MTESATTQAIEATAAPADATVETLDVRSLGPPEPLRQTLETLAELPSGTVLAQHNDRAPKHLFPKLEDRGYTHETVQIDDVTVTVIWEAD